ncbi:hypothetical protein ACJQWK_07298 [Exserohilum turcicum]
MGCIKRRKRRGIGPQVIVSTAHKRPNMHVLSFGTFSCISGCHLHQIFSDFKSTGSMRSRDMRDTRSGKEKLQPCPRKPFKDNVKHICFCLDHGCRVLQSDSRHIVDALIESTLAARA